MHTLELTHRPRRVRASHPLRRMTEETFLLPCHLAAPLFLIEGKNIRQPISSLPGVERLSIDLLLKEVEELANLGILAIDLFPYIPHEKRDAFGSEALRANNLMQEATKAVKNAFPEICVMVDIALDPYTNHGHDGVIDASGFVMNDETVKVLSQMSLMAAEAGADFVAPSDMMDGRVGAIRKELDRNGFSNVGIISYAAKYASALYSPFREALDSAPRFGDKKSYQLSPCNSREAVHEALLDAQEGADVLLVKPALSYLDIIYKIRQTTVLPIAAYHVSGEYALVMAAHEKGWMDANKLFLEQFTSIRRAGADFILTYASKRIAKLLNG